MRKVKSHKGMEAALAAFEEEVSRIVIGWRSRNGSVLICDRGCV